MVDHYYHDKSVNNKHLDGDATRNNVESMSNDSFDDFDFVSTGDSSDLAEFSETEMLMQKETSRIKKLAMWVTNTKQTRENTNSLLEILRSEYDPSLPKDIANFV